MKRFQLCICLVVLQLVSGWPLRVCIAEDSVIGNSGNSGAIIEDNEIYQNNLAGIRIRGDIPVSIEKCKIFSNGGAGITTRRKGSLTVRKSDISQNENAGIDIEGAAHALIEDSKIYRNRLAGIRMETGKSPGATELSAAILNNDIYMNGAAGVDSMSFNESSVDLALTGNAIYKNEMAGVNAMAVSRLTAKGNRICSNGAAGILSSETAAPPRLDIYQNTVSFNGGAGIYIQNGINGSLGIRNNWIFNNLYSGIVCGLIENPANKLTDIDIMNNTIVSNGSDERGAGIWNEGKGKVTLKNNIVAYNYTTGIRLRTCREYTHNLAFANGDLPSGEDAGPYPAWVENRQFGGCPGTGRGGLVIDPLFADPDNYDFSLQDGSPAIDAGDNNAIYHDLSRHPSKGTSRNDMGATGGPYAAAPEI